MATFKNRDKGRRTAARDYHKIAMAAAREDYSFYGVVEDAYDVYKWKMAEFNVPALNFYAFKEELTKE